MPSWLLAVLAVLGTILGAGGIGVQVVSWLRERSKHRRDIELKKIDADLAAKKIDADAEKSEREDTGQFQNRLMDRVIALEKEKQERDERDKKAAEDCEMRVSDAERAAADARTAAQEATQKAQDAFAEAQRTSAEMEQLERDYDVLLAHAIDVEQQARKMRAQLGVTTVPTSSARLMEVAARRKTSRIPRAVVSAALKKR